MLGSRFCLLECEDSGEEVIVPAEILEDGKVRVVEGLGPECFAGLRQLKSIVLPDTIEHIAVDAFDGVKEQIESIRFDGEDADCHSKRDGSKLLLLLSNEEEVIVPEDVAELGDCVFAGCINLRTLVLHDGMKKPTVKALSSSKTLSRVVLTNGAEINVAKQEAKKCFTISKGVIGFNFQKYAELMLDAGDAKEFKRVVDEAKLEGPVLDGFYQKIKMKRKPEFKEMKEFLLERLMLHSESAQARPAPQAQIAASG